jgi:hypothetical protein
MPGPIAEADAFLASKVTPKDLMIIRAGSSCGSHRGPGPRGRKSSRRREIAEGTRIPILGAKGVV